MPSPQMHVDGVQWGWERHPLPLAVDGGHEGSPRRTWGAAEGLSWHLEGDGVLSVRTVPEPQCRLEEPDAGLGRAQDSGVGELETRASRACLLIWKMGHCKAWV